MLKLGHYRSLLILAGVVVLLLSMESLAAACPTCKDTLEANDPARANLVRGYFYSILFMLSMPFLILTSLCGYFYYEVCKARRLNKAATTGRGVPSLTLESTGS